MSVLLIQADARSLPLSDKSVQCCVTSPPYYGLRNYGVDGQIGLEETPDSYVATLVAVFREVRRVLKDDGTVWLNLGDSYAGNPGGAQGKTGQRADRTYTANMRSFRPGSSRADGIVDDRVKRNRNGIGAVQGVKNKDLVGIPWMVAFALRADGWYLRSDIVWAKPNPMPESVTDRPTRSHEYVFLLTKSARYYYDKDAIAEPCSDALIKQVEDGYTGAGLKDYEGAGVQNPSDVKSRIIGNLRKRADRFGGNKHGGDTTKHSDGSVYTGRPTRNKRSVWFITPKPYRGAHFATFPPALVEPCILAGSRPGDTVLDPFGGSGTTGVVAQQHGRNAVLCDLNPEYLALAKRRLAGEREPTRRQAVGSRPAPCGLQPTMEGGA